MVKKFFHLLPLTTGNIRDTAPHCRNHTFSPFGPRKTASDIANKIGRTKSYDEAAGGKELYETITSEQWWNKLEQKNKQQVAIAKSKLEAKSREEYSDLLNKEHQDYIAKAKQNQSQKSQLNYVTTKEHESLMEDISKAAGFLIDNGIKNEHQILHTHKTSITPQKIRKALIEQCREHHAGIIQNNLNIIKDNKPIHMNNIEFNCPRKYLEHLQEHHKHNEYMPMHHINQTAKSLEVEHQLQLQKQREIQLQKQHEMAGPSL